ncbi:3-ketoacyl-CoA synthase 1, partial [Monoraphidium neglectum]
MREARASMLGAAEAVFAKTGVSPRDVQIVVTVCSVFTPTPSLASMVVNHFRMTSSVVTYHLGGMGCSGGAVGINLIHDLLKPNLDESCQHASSNSSNSSNGGMRSSSNESSGSSGRRGSGRSSASDSSNSLPSNGRRRQAGSVATARAARPGCNALLLCCESMTKGLYTGDDLSRTAAMCVFRQGGAAVLLSNRRAAAWRAKYRLLHSVRAHIGADDTAYSDVPKSAQKAISKALTR